MSAVNLQPLVQSYGPYAGPILVGFVSGVFPLVNLELVLIATVTYFGVHENLWVLALAGAVGQMCAKCCIYFASAGVLRIRPWKGIHPQKIEHVSKRLMQGGLEGDLVMASASFLGIPPILITSFVAGMARYPLHKFIPIGLVGRFFRFYIVVLFPEIFQKIPEYLHLKSGGG